MKNRKKLVSILAAVMAAIMVLTLVLSLMPTKAYAASSSEIRKQINGLQEKRTEMKSQMKELQDQYKANEDEISDIVARKNLIDQEIGLLHAQVDNINEQITAYGVLIADKQDELDAAQENYDNLNEEYKTRIRTMEEEGTLSYWEVLFKANSFSDLLDRMSMIEEIAASDNRRLEALDEATKAVATAQEELATEKADLEQTKEELNSTQAELDAKREEADGVIAELVAKGQEIEGLQDELESEDQDLLKQIAQMEKEYNAAKHQEWLAYMATYTTVAPATTAPSGGNSGGSGNNGSSTPSSGGSWLRPCSYTYMSSPFGFRTSPTAGASSYHQGVDLAAPANTPVYASRSGIVTTTTYSNAAGYYVTINHGDGFSSIYMHLNNYVVSAGQAVSAGQLIGYVGRTGIATGYHLHFGIAYNGAYVNPCAYVSL
ncbi:peptidoglycan DD-metalloendopeptidase family protein [Pseudoflavonifractor sp. MSJ-30]|uniref:murein hydrolase activator EnvC family protein n=1 Tax=Pseudoflavonifractor sp. MSJ-30 TaxID=2841525 RepID=UPI001C11DFD7|nr:M23 family metallopeptidase [Pseudoflavonifractor sp. MSJ-30]MBU5452074.1 peptidoglycan DD-metalloendopeptidase family protein [Pseudoflavonifractor sp. MSJ-30]